MYEDSIRQGEIVGECTHPRSENPGYACIWLLLGTNAYEVDNSTHTYTALGTYNMTCVAINAIGNTTILYVVVVQIPVSILFELNSSAPVVFTTGAPITSQRLSRIPRQIFVSMHVCC